MPFAALLQAIAIERQTLSLSIRHNQVEKKVLLERGVPVDCRSNLAHETLGRFMVAEGKLSADAMNSSLALSASRGVQLGEVLIERELVTATELYRILQQNLAKKLLDVFTWRTGEFSIEAEVPVVSSPLKVKTPQLILTGIIRFALQEDVDRAIVPFIGRKLGIHPSPPFPLEEIRLTAAQQTLTDRLRSGLRVDELAAVVDLPYEEISRVVYALAIVGIVVPAELIPITAARSTPVPPVIPAAASQPLITPGPDQSRLRDRIMQSYLQFRRQDAFELLQLEETATVEQIDEAFIVVAQRTAPWQFDENALADLRDKAREVFIAASRSYGELADKERRNTLITRRRTLREEHRRSLSAGRFALKTDLLDPEEQYRKAQVLLQSGKLKDAITFLEFASDCDPQNGIYRSELAYARFSLSKYAARESLLELERVKRIDSACGLAWLYAGEIHRISGTKDEAETNLKRACKLMTGDRRPVEALKTLMSSR